ncbi:hypothetical protein NC652_037510 [Populus alba x Populus x berolinensis]|nr:hypothetical protein NC652_037510 [Populus alba x Populus x berolinensis]
MALYDSVTCRKASKKKDLVDEDNGLKTIEGRCAVEWHQEQGQSLLKFYTEEKERYNGVLAICAAKSAAQPYISLATISSLIAEELS